MVSIEGSAAFMATHHLTQRYKVREPLQVAETAVGSVDDTANSVLELRPSSRRSKVICCLAEPCHS